MKNILIAIVALLFVPSLLFAQVTYPNRGGTGTSVIPSAGQVLVGQANGTYVPQATSTLGISGGTGGGSISVNPLVANYVTATSASATSTFNNLSVATAFNLLGTAITNVSTWFSGLFNTNFAAKTTDNLTEGASNLYFTVLRARNSLTDSIVGVDYSTSTGVISLTSGYVIPTTTRAVNWDLAFGWGNHALMGYLATNTGNWAGPFQGQNAAYYLSRANHTGTQATNTITGVFAVSNGGTGSSTVPTLGQVLVGQANGSYAPQATSTLGIAGGGGAGGVYLATTSTAVIGQALYLASNSQAGTFATTTATAGTGITFSVPFSVVGSSPVTISSPFNGTIGTTSALSTGQVLFVTGPSSTAGVATGTLTTTATGTQYSATQALIGGSSVFSWQTGYDAVLAASTTQWKAFYDTPSSRITAGSGLSWSGNTLNAVGSTNYLTNSGSNTLLNTGTNLQAPTFQATSTSGTNLFAGNVAVGTSTAPTPLWIEQSNPSDGYTVTALRNSTSTGRAELALSAGADQPYYSGFITMSGSGVTNYPNTMEVGCGFVGCGLNFWTDGFLQGRMGTNGNVAFGSTTGLTSKLLLQGTVAGQTLLTVASTTGATMFTIAGNSNVGIGSTTPSATLSISATSGVPAFMISSSSSSTNAFMIDTNGNAIFGANTASLENGIKSFVSFVSNTGTDAYTTFNNLSSGKAMVMRVHSNSSYAHFDIVTPTVSWLTGTFGNDDLSLYDGTTNVGVLSIRKGNTANRLTIDASGLIGISSSTPTSMLDIKVATGTNPLNIASSSGTSLLTLTNAGFLGLGTTSPLSALAVVGTTTTQGLRIYGLPGTRALFLDASGNATSTAASASLSSALSDETGTGVAVFGTTPTFTTNITDPLVIGGTAVSSALTLKSTSGAGTSDAIIFQVGNNGAREAGRITTNAFWGLGSTSPAYQFVSASSTDPSRYIGYTTTGTSTLYLMGTTTLGSVGSQIIMRDSTGTGCTKITTNAGTLVAAVVTCP